MAVFVLVHGGWVGGWYWSRVAPLLQAAGHRVFAPTLTGLGERAHLCSLAVDLDTHVQDVTNVLQFEDLHDVILVGHSYGGIVITGVAERTAERLAHLCYLDAFVPRDGQALADFVGPEMVADAREKAKRSRDGSRPDAIPSRSRRGRGGGRCKLDDGEADRPSAEYDSATYTAVQPRRPSSSSHLYLL